MARSSLLGKMNIHKSVQWCRNSLQIQNSGKPRKLVNNHAYLGQATDFSTNPLH